MNLETQCIRLETGILMSWKKKKKTLCTKQVYFDEMLRRRKCQITLDYCGWSFIINFNQTQRATGDLWALNEEIKCQNYKSQAQVILLFILTLIIASLQFVSPFIWRGVGKGTFQLNFTYIELKSFCAF